MNISRFFSLVASLVLVMVTGSAMPADAASDLGKPGSRPDRIVLNAGPNVATSQIITWRTSTKMKKGYVQIRTGNGKIRNVKQRTTTTSKPSNRSYKALHHTATVWKLRPGTVYRYRVGAKGKRSPWMSFRTAPNTQSWSLVSVGDTQLGSKAWLQKVFGRAFKGAPRASAIVQLGDMVEDPRRDNDWGSVLEAFGRRLSRINLFYTPGNHEQCLLKRCSAPSKTAYRAHFEFANNGVRGQTQDWYYSDINNVRIVSLNSFGPLTTQRAFLDKALSTSKKTWNIVMFHAPVFSGAKDRSNSAMRKAWLPTLEKYDVDLVLSGHDHVYSRGHLNGNPDGPQYAIQVTSPKFYELSPGSGNDWDKNGATRVVKVAQTATYQILDFGPTTLRYRAVVAAKGKGATTTRKAGQTLDQFTIYKADGSKTVD